MPRGSIPTSTSSSATFERAATSFMRVAGPRMIHQDASHLLAGDRKKVQLRFWIS
jgi:hypothetical protein